MLLPEFSKAPRWYHALIHWFCRNPLPLLAFLVITFAASCAMLPRLRVVSDLRSMIPNDKVARSDAEIRERFQIHDYMIVVIETPESAYSVETVAYVSDLTKAIESMPGVRRTRSVLKEDDIRSDFEGGVTIEPFVPSLTPESIAGARSAVRDFPRIGGLLVSHDEQHISILAELEPSASKASVYHDILHTLSTTPVPDAHRSFISGMPVFEGVLGEYILRDLMVMLPLAGAALILLLLLVFRSWKFAALCLVETLFVDVVTLGLMAAMDVPLLLIQSVMPVILMGLAITDEIHIFGRYFEEARRSPVRSTEPRCCGAEARRGRTSARRGR